MGWDNETMFSDGQSVTGTAAILSAQSVNLGPLNSDITGRNIGVGTSLWIEVYGSAAASSTISGTMTLEVITTTDDQLTAGLVVVWSKASLALPNPAGGAAVKANIWKLPMPILPNLLGYLGLRYTFTSSPASNLTLTSGITSIPAALRAVGSGMNFN